MIPDSVEKYIESLKVNLVDLVQSLLKFHQPKMQILIAGEQWDKGCYEGLKEEQTWHEIPPFIQFIGGWARGPNKPGEPVQTYTKPGANTYAAAFTQGIFGEILDGEDRPEEDQARIVQTTNYSLRVVQNRLTELMGLDVPGQQPNFAALRDSNLKRQGVDIAGNRRNLFLEARRFNIKTGSQFERANRNFRPIIGEVEAILQENTTGEEVNWSVLNSARLRSIRDKTLYRSLKADNIDDVVVFMMAIEEAERLLEENGGNASAINMENLYKALYARGEKDLDGIDERKIFVKRVRRSAQAAIEHLKREERTTPRNPEEKNNLFKTMQIGRASGRERV